MSFKVGDRIKRPRGKMVYEIIRKPAYRGRYRVLNVNTGKYYNMKDLTPFELYDPFRPRMDSKDLKYDFKHGV